MDARTNTHIRMATVLARQIAPVPPEWNARRNNLFQLI